MTETTEQVVERLSRKLYSGKHEHNLGTTHSCLECIRAALREALRIGREQMRKEAIEAVEKTVVWVSSSDESVVRHRSLEAAAAAIRNLSTEE